MQILNRGQATSVANASGTTVTAIKPNGCIANDFAMCTFAVAGNGAGWVAPTGWTLFIPTQVLGGTFYAVYYRKLDGGSDDTPTGSWTTSGRNSVLMIAWSGVHQTNPLATNGAYFFPGSAQQTLSLTDSSAPAEAGTRLVTGAVLDVTSASALAEPEETSPRASVANTAAARRQAIADEIRTAIGPALTRLWRQSATTYRIGGWLICLRPHPDPPVLKTRTDPFTFTDKAAVAQVLFKVANDLTTELYEQTAINVTRPALTDSFTFTDSSSLLVITPKAGTDNFAFTDNRKAGAFSATITQSENYNVSDIGKLFFSAETRTLRFTDAPVFVHPLRVIAQSIRTKEFLHWDLPVQNLRITYTLSGPQIITGTYANENTELLGIGIEPWGTWIHVEDNGRIVASGILQPYSTIGYDQELNIEAHGVSAYPVGIPFLGEASYVRADPANIVANIWTHLQSRPDVNLGVQVIGSTSARVGLPVPPEDTNPDNDNDQPFQLVWWEAPDCGEVINTLIREAGFDFVEQQYWNEGKTDVIHRILIADRIGSRRDGISFIEGENLVNPVQTMEDTSTYASEVWVFGAGEGKTIVKGYYGGPNSKGRIRRTYTLQDGTIKTDKRANEIAQYEYLRRQGLLDVSQIVVSARSDNAPIGSFDTGDDVTLDVEIPWVGNVRQWERIIGITFDTDNDTLTLDIRRSETFKNG